MFGRSCHGSPNSGTLWSLQNKHRTTYPARRKTRASGGERWFASGFLTPMTFAWVWHETPAFADFANPCFLSTSILLMSASGALSDLRLRNSQPIIELGLFESMTCKAMTKLAAFRILDSGHENNTVTQGCMSSCPWFDTPVSSNVAGNPRTKEGLNMFEWEYNL